MESGAFVLERTFSELTGLQCASVVQYRLTTGPAGCRFSLEDAEGAEQWDAPELGAAQGRILLQYLYENAVQRPHWQDVLQDAAARLKQQG